MALSSAELIEAESRLNISVQEFYDYLESKGEDYGRLGGEVTSNQGWQGEAANGFAESAGSRVSKDYSHGSEDSKTGTAYI